MALTKRQIDAATYHGDGRNACYLWDGNSSPFGLRIHPGGTKTFVVTYRREGRRRFYKLGRYGPITLDQARKMATQVLAQAENEKRPDPADERIAKRKEPRMAAFCADYMNEHAKPYKQARSVKEDARMINSFILPALGRYKIGNVTKRRIAELHRKIGEKTPYQANRVLALLTTVFMLAVDWDLIEKNPCLGIRRFREEPRKRYLTPTELARLATALTNAPPSPAIDAIWLLIYTGLQKSEILTLRWAYFDADRKVLRLPETKTGARDVQLNKQALAVLSAIQRDPANPHVIVGRWGKGHLVNLREPWQRIRRQAGIEGARLHDIRHSFASISISSGLGLAEVQKLLGHKDARTTERYAHLIEERERAATEQTGDAVADAMKVKLVR